MEMKYSDNGGYTVHPAANLNTRRDKVTRTRTRLDGPISCKLAIDKTAAKRSTSERSFRRV